MQYEIYRGMVEKLMDDRLAKGVNEDRDGPRAHEPELWCLFRTEVEPRQIPVPDGVWRVTRTPGEALALVTAILETTFKKIEPPDDYYGVAYIDEAWERIEVATAEARDELMARMRGRSLGEDPEAHTVIVGCAYTPRDETHLYITQRPGEKPLDVLGPERDRTEEHLIEGEVPSGVKILADVLMGTETSR